MFDPPENTSSRRQSSAVRDASHTEVELPSAAQQRWPVVNSVQESANKKTLNTSLFQFGALTIRIIFLYTNLTSFDFSFDVYSGHMHRNCA